MESKDNITSVSDLGGAGGVADTKTNPLTHAHTFPTMTPNTPLFCSLRLTSGKRFCSVAASTAADTAKNGSKDSANFSDPEQSGKFLLY